MSAQLVGAAGLGLVVANAWTGPQHKRLAPVLGSGGDMADAHQAMKEIGVELLAVGALALVAGEGGNASRGALAAVTCLWVVWAMRHPWGGTWAGGQDVGGSFGGGGTWAGGGNVGGSFGTPPRRNPRGPV